ncbi:class I SAM-dependent methyltransferase [Bradyrhizobium vignae]|uniref:class I SAM-dependent methyltransferase n=1 Tax=Bradyrhizobium vignae TaxID=1549949 RepID=UPI00100A8285|nr:class I SAM-dependent methyltransferase [Bradyrhizobium vignae]RXG83962.1 class I SAM-dependent methyltransferase [Bradyrhizobium vignae]
MSLASSPLAKVALSGGSCPSPEEETLGSCQHEYGKSRGASVSDSAAQFDEFASLHENMTDWPLQKYIEVPSVLEVIGDVDGLSILDFGCGAGAYSRILKQRGAAYVVGYDPAPGMLNYARRRAEKEGINLSFVAHLHANMAAQFDLVLASYVLPYAATKTELDSMCAEMAGLLRPGGRLISLSTHPAYNPHPNWYEPCGFRLVVDNPENPYLEGGRIKVEFCKHGEQGGIFAWHWPAPSLESSLAQAGFRSLKWRELFVPTDAPLDQLPKELHAYLQSPHAIIIEGIRAPRHAERHP